MKKYFTIMAMAVFAFACQEKQNSPEIADIYYGITPCADCPGIYYELDLNEDMTYTEKYLYLESDVDTISTEGNYEIQADSVVALTPKSNEEGFYNQLKISGKELIILDKDGNEITNDLAEFYVLGTNQPETPKNMTNKNKFKATGNEPFWAVEITPGREMLFKPMDGKQISFPVPEPETTETSKVFSASGNGESLKVEISNETCQDNMSGEYFSHKVSVTFKNADMENPQTWTGCGGYVSGNLEEIADKVNGDWVLRQINGETLPEKPDYKTPTMKIVLMEGQVSGNAGCNQYSGQIKHLEGNKLSVFRAISTKMACPGLDVESKFLGVFSGEPIEFERKENRLIFKNGETELIFEQV